MRCKSRQVLTSFTSLTDVLFSGYSPMLTPPIPHLAYKAAIYNLTTLCLNKTLSCVDFMDVIMRDIPVFCFNLRICLHYRSSGYSIFTSLVRYISHVGYVPAGSNKKVYMAQYCLNTSSNTVWLYQNKPSTRACSIQGILSVLKTE